MTGESKAPTELLQGGIGSHRPCGGDSAPVFFLQANIQELWDQEPHIGETRNDQVHGVKKASRHPPVVVLSVGRAGVTACKSECGKQWVVTSCVDVGPPAAVCHWLGPVS